MKLKQKLDDYYDRSPASGYHTYIAAIGAMLVGLGNFMMGNLDLAELIMIVTTALGFSGLKLGQSGAVRKLTPPARSRASAVKK